MPIRLIGCKLALLGPRRFQRLLSDSISARLGKFTVESFYDGVWDCLLFMGVVNIVPNGTGALELRGLC